MTEEQEINIIPASEEVVDTGAEAQVEQSVRQVPLRALEAERHKRQEAEARSRLLEEYVLKHKQQQEAAVNEEEENDLVSRKEFRQSTATELAALKREIAEDTFKDVYPEAVKQINTHLKDILERKPWLVKTIEEAPNRYARAYEIVQDYMPAQQARKSGALEAQKIVENSQKPGSTVGSAKIANVSQAEYLKSIAGTKEFRDYRSKLLQGK